MKMIFVVYDYEINGKRYAVADTIQTGTNLLAIREKADTTACHLCESRKQAKQIAFEWNKSYMANGTSIYPIWQQRQ